MVSVLLALLLAPAANFAEPSWIAQPTADEMFDAYPTAALERGVGGEVVLDCRVRTSGALGGCKVVSETPAKAGFAKASLEVVKLYRVKPVGPRGLPIVGRPVRIPVVWTPPKRFLADDGPYDLAPQDRLRWQGRVRPSRAVGNVKSVKLICRITETGRLSPCAEPGKRETYDGPAKWTLRQFQAEPLDADGKPTSGRLVVVNVPPTESRLP